MSTVGWQSVVNIVEKEFPTYMPVPSREVEDYRIFNFVCLPKWPQTNPGYPKFYYYGKESDMTQFSSTLKPAEVTSKKLWAYNDGFPIKRSQTSTDCSKDNITISFGTISEHKVSYGRLESWLRKLENLREAVVTLAKERRLFIIHSVIMAEELTIKEGSDAEDKVFTAVGNRSLNRPKEFGDFPIGFKVGGVVVKQVGIGDLLRYGLELEDMTFFNMAYKERWVPLAKSI